MPAATIIVILAVVAVFATFMLALAYGQWVTRDITSSR
jgi:hypothetical protein